MEPTTFAQDEASTNYIKQDASALIAGIHSAVAYSGFRSGQYPDRGDGANNPSAEEILEDLRILSDSGRFPLIRLYDSQESSEMILNLISEYQLPLKVMLGAWLDAELSNHKGCAWLTEPIPERELIDNRLANEAEVRRTIHLAKSFPDVVVAVNIGNEALIDWNDHLVSIESMVTYLGLVKEAIDQPVSTADNYVAWINYATELFTVVDFAGVHTYPIWEHKPIEEGLSYTIENMVAVQQVIPEVPLAIMEAGWGTTASEFHDQANEENQTIYFKALMAWAKEMNVTTFWFEAFDEDWKGNPDDRMGAEKHWGLYTVDRKPKAAVR
jgi:exo-beta-1,3-glucanase (GH17 family)